MSNLTLTPAFFSLETIGDRLFAGYTEREDWNGWARPYFLFETAQQIADAVSEFQTAFYDANADAFVFEVEDDEPEIFGALSVEGIGKIYPIGAGSWIWEKAEEIAA